MSEIDIYKHIGQQMINDREKIKELEIKYNKALNDLVQESHKRMELEAEIQELNDSITWWNNRYNALQRDYEDYKSRCEKADEYIKKHIEKCNIDGYEGKFDNFDIFTKPQKLSNILNGRSDE